MGSKTPGGGTPKGHLCAFFSPSQRFHGKVSLQQRKWGGQHGRPEKKHRAQMGYRGNFPLHLLAAAILVIVWLMATRNSSPVGLASEGEPVPAAFRVFWKGFTFRAGRALVVFSNAAFIGRPETGMRYRDATRDAGAYILDTTPAWRGLQFTSSIACSVSFTARPRQTRQPLFRSTTPKQQSDFHRFARGKSFLLNSGAGRFRRSYARLENDPVPN